MVSLFGPKNTQKPRDIEYAQSESSGSESQEDTAAKLSFSASERSSTWRKPGTAPNDILLKLDRQSDCVTQWQERLYLSALNDVRSPTEGVTELGLMNAHGIGLLPLDLALAPQQLGKTLASRKDFLAQYNLPETLSTEVLAPQHQEHENIASQTQQRQQSVLPEARGESRGNEKILNDEQKAWQSLSLQAALRSRYPFYHLYLSQLLDPYKRSTYKDRHINVLAELQHQLPDLVTADDKKSRSIKGLSRSAMEKVLARIWSLGQLALRKKTIPSWQRQALAQLFSELHSLSGDQGFDKVIRAILTLKYKDIIETNTNGVTKSLQLQLSSPAHKLDVLSSFVKQALQKLHHEFAAGFNQLRHLLSSYKTEHVLAKAQAETRSYIDHLQTRFPALLEASKQWERTSPELMKHFLASYADFNKEQFKAMLSLLSDRDSTLIPIEHFTLMLKLKTVDQRAITNHFIQPLEEGQPLLTLDSAAKAVFSEEKPAVRALNQLGFLLADNFTDYWIALDAGRHEKAQEYKAQLVSVLKTAFSQSNAVGKERMQPDFENYSFLMQRVKDRVDHLQQVALEHQQLIEQLPSLFAQRSVELTWASELFDYISQALEQADYSVSQHINVKQDRSCALLHTHPRLFDKNRISIDPRPAERLALTLLSRILAAQLSGDVDRVLISEALKLALKSDQPQVVNELKLKTWLEKPENSVYSARLDETFEHYNPAPLYPIHEDETIDLSFAQAMFQKIIEHPVEADDQQTDLLSAWAGARAQLKALHQTNNTWAVHRPEWYQSVFPQLKNLKRALAKKTPPTALQDERLLSVFHAEATEFYRRCETMVGAKELKLSDFIQEKYLIIRKLDEVKRNEPILKNQKNDLAYYQKLISLADGISEIEAQIEQGVTVTAESLKPSFDRLFPLLEVNALKQSRLLNNAARLLLQFAIDSSAANLSEGLTDAQVNALKSFVSGSPIDDKIEKSQCQIEKQKVMAQVKALEEKLRNVKTAKEAYVNFIRLSKIFEAQLLQESGSRLSEASSQAILNKLVPCLHADAIKNGPTVKYIEALLKQDMGLRRYDQSLKQVEQSHPLIGQTVKLFEHLPQLSTREARRRERAINTFVSLYQPIYQQLQNGIDQAHQTLPDWVRNNAQSKLSLVRTKLYNTFNGNHESDQREALFNELFDVFGADQYGQQQLRSLLKDSIQEIGFVNDQYYYRMEDVLLYLKASAKALIQQHQLPQEAITVFEYAPRMMESSRNQVGLLEYVNRWVNTVLPTTRGKPAKQSGTQSQAVKPSFLMIPYLPIGAKATEAGAANNIWHWVGMVAAINQRKEVTLTFINPMNTALEHKDGSKMDWQETVIKHFRNKLGLKTREHPLSRVQQQQDLMMCGIVLCHIGVEMMSYWAGQDDHTLPDVIQDIDRIALRQKQLETLKNLTIEGQKLPFDLWQGFNLH